MNLSVSKKDLSSGLSAVLKSINANNVLPILGNVLLVAGKESLMLSGTNLEIGISKTIPALVKDQGHCTVPAKMFSELVSTLADEEVKLKFDEKDYSVTVTSGKSKSKVKGIDAEEFPPVLTTDEFAFEIPSDTLQALLSEISFCASNDEARPVLTNVQLRISNGLLSVAATDGYRIGYMGIEHNANDISALIPAKSASVLSKIITSNKEVESIGVLIEDNKAIFKVGTTEFVTILSDGNFPDYNVIVPKSFTTKVRTNLASLATAVKQAGIIAKEGNNAVHLNIKNNLIIVSSVSEERGNNETVLQDVVLFDGNDVELVFNVDFLLGILNGIGYGDVVIEANTPKSPVKITDSSSGDSRYYIIMPMSLG
jgi:DNA polymerase-3 subunit beta